MNQDEDYDMWRSVFPSFSFFNIAIISSTILFSVFNLRQFYAPE